MTLTSDEQMMVRTRTFPVVGILSKECAWQSLNESRAVVLLLGASNLSQSGRQKESLHLQLVYGWMRYHP